MIHSDEERLLQKQWMQYQRKLKEILGPETYLRAFFKNEQWTLNDQEIQHHFKTFFTLSFEELLALKTKIESTPLETDGKMPAEPAEFTEWFQSQSEKYKTAIFDYKLRFMKLGMKRRLKGQ